MNNIEDKRVIQYLKPFLTWNDTQQMRLTCKNLSHMMSLHIYKVKPKSYGNRIIMVLFAPVITPSTLTANITGINNGIAQYNIPVARQQISLFPNLTYLDLSMDTITFAKYENHHLRYLGLLTKLRYLSISCQTELTNKFVETEISSLIDLEELNITACARITNKGFRMICNNHPKLKHLNINLCPRITSLKELHKLRNLVSFEMKGCYKIKKVDQLQQLSKLESIGLTENQNIDPNIINNLPNLKILMVWLSYYTIDKDIKNRWDTISRQGLTIVYDS